MRVTVVFWRVCSLYIKQFWNLWLMFIFNELLRKSIALNYTSIPLIVYRSWTPHIHGACVQYDCASKKKVQNIYVIDVKFGHILRMINWLIIVRIARKNNMNWIIDETNQIERCSREDIVVIERIYFVSFFKSHVTFAQCSTQYSWPLAKREKTTSWKHARDLHTYIFFYSGGSHCRFTTICFDMYLVFAQRIEFIFAILFSITAWLTVSLCSLALPCCFSKLMNKMI